jgi:hypothetical protein
MSPTIHFEDNRTVAEFQHICCVERCGDRFKVVIDTRHHAFGLARPHVWDSVVNPAAAVLGWRRVAGKIEGGMDTSKVYCGFHVDKLGLLCARCPAMALHCTCMGGPRFDARLP